MIRSGIRGLFTFCIVFLCKTQSFPLKEKTEAGDISKQRFFAKEYLQKHGYLREEGATSEDFLAALKSFQTEVGLESTYGSLNEEALKIMSLPRCGTPPSTSGRKKPYYGRPKRFVPHNPKWEHATLTWRLSDPFNMLAPYDYYIARNTLHRAFNDWSTATRRTLRFVESREPNATATDLDIFFATGSHNDSLPFDGPDGIVAHGFYPTDGNLHFDAAEKWTLNMPEGINLYQTAIHEIGHLLGLEHSTDYRAVMFPINRPFDPQFRLSEDDVRGIRYLYNPWTWSTYLRQYYLRHYQDDKDGNEYKT